MIRPRGLADLTRDACIVTVNFDADKTMLFDGFAHEFAHASAILFRVHESESEEAIGSPTHDARDVAVGAPIVRMKSREEDRAVDPGVFAPSARTPSRMPAYPTAR